ncbi:hypothetical protein GWI33_007278, partial [Rhynchophorus ferrugineus]
PSQPPIKTKPNNCYVAKLVEPYCHCDFHLYEPEMGRYMKLAEKEKVLYEELDNLKKRMAVLVGDILDHPCDTDDEKMKTIYETDYVKRVVKSSCLDRVAELRPRFGSDLTPRGYVLSK